jgi:hypothetical protein
MIIGMNWLESHEVVLNCKGEMFYFIKISRHKRILAKTNRGVYLRFISIMKLKKSLRKGCKLYIVIAMNKKEDTVKIVQHHILS